MLDTAYLEAASINRRSQLVVPQPASFSFFHRGQPCMAQLVARRLDGRRHYFGRLTLGLGRVPFSAQIGVSRRAALLAAVATSQRVQADHHYHINKSQWVFFLSEELLSIETIPTKLDLISFVVHKLLRTEAGLVEMTRFFRTPGLRNPSFRNPSFRNPQQNPPGSFLQNGSL